MSANNSDDQGNMSDHGNGASAGTDKAVWDDKAVSDMYFSIVEIRGGFSASEAAQVEQSMRARGYNFTAKQLQTKHNKLKIKMAKETSISRPATAAGNGAEAKPKATRKPRAKAAPKTDETGSPINKAKAAPKPRKTLAKKVPNAEFEEDGNEIEVEAEAGPPNKKRKAAGAKAGKKVIHQTVKNEENAEEEGNASMIDINHSSAAAFESNGLSDDDAAAQKTEVQVETAQKTKVDAHATAKKYDAENGGEFDQQMDLVEASKADVDAEDEDSDPNAQLHSKNVHIEAYVVQTFA